MWNSSKLTIKTPERRRPGVFIVNFEHILRLVLVFIVNFKQVNAGWAWGRKMCKLCTFKLLKVKLLNIAHLKFLSFLKGYIGNIHCLMYKKWNSFVYKPFVNCLCSKEGYVYNAENWHLLSHQQNFSMQ